MEELGRAHVAVIVPLFRAPEEIGRVLKGIPPWVQTVVVVDDGSGDDSAERVRGIADPRVALVLHPENRGVGAAVLTGYREAIARGAEVLVKMDGDDQMDPAQLHRVVAPIMRGEADYAKGNRFLHTRELGSMPWARRLGNLGLSFLTKLASGYWDIFDPTNGYTALHASVLPLLDATRLHPRFFFETSLLVELGLARAVVRDVPIPARYGDGPSHLSVGGALAAFPFLLVRGAARRLMVQYYLRDFTLVSLFLPAGATLAGGGTLFGAWHWYRSSAAGTSTPAGTIMLAALPVLLGIQLLLQAVVADMQGVPTRPLQVRE